MRRRERTREGQASEVPGAHDGYGCVSAGEGEHAETTNHDRDGRDAVDPASDSQARPSARGRDWQVGDECVEVAVSSRYIQAVKALLKLVPGQASF